MKTDELFYELFRFSPESLLELLQLEVHGRYCFESVTVKSTEKRIDGYFRSEDGGGPDVFLEVQGYSDDNIYWRLFREICAFHEEMGLSEDRKKALNDLLEYAILQRFKTLTLKEIREMIQLTPLEETVAGKELMEKGKEIGKIQLLQLLLKQPQSPENALEVLNIEALKAMLAGLEAELAKKANWG